MKPLIASSIAGIAQIPQNEVRSPPSEAICCAPSWTQTQKRASGNEPHGESRVILNPETEKATAAANASADELAPYLAGICQGDERALETLYDATVAKLYALASAILK